MKHIEWNKITTNKNAGEEGVIITSYGVVNIEDFGPQNKIWVGDTNFVIDEDFFNATDNTLGVESFEVITPYKFVVTIGKLFSEQQILNDIETIIKEETEEIIKLQEKLQKYSDWAIFVLPNGKINYTHTEESSFNENLKMYHDLKKEVGGRIITRNPV